MNDAIRSRTSPHLVADGGAMVLQKAAPDLLPELVLGDFDSAKQEILQHYRDRPSFSGLREKRGNNFLNPRSKAIPFSRQD